jgi:transposase
MAIFKRFWRKKRRKYPVKLDEKGKSARSRCFEMFIDNTPLSEIAKIVGVKIGTVRRYHQQWKKNPNFERQHAFIKELLKKTAPDRERTIELFARAWGITKEQLEAILEQPHGLRRLMTGKFYFPGHADADHKRYVALELALLISDHLTKNGGKFEDVAFAFRRWLRESQESREEGDRQIEEENKDIAFMRRILEASAENERQGRVKPDRLSDEERDAILRGGLESLVRGLERTYWLRMAGLMAEGFTLDQAREKVYQDLLEKGDLKGAKMMREYQDVIHPLKPGDQLPPPSPPQPPPSPK